MKSPPSAMASRRPEPLARGGDESVLSDLRSPVRIKAASLADQAAIYELLFLAHRCASRDAFHEWRDAPNYHAADRLIARRGGALVGHVHVQSRHAQFGEERVGLAILRDLVAPNDPEAHRAVLAAALEESQRGGAVIALGEAALFGGRAAVVATLLSAEAEPHAVLAATSQKSERSLGRRAEVWRMVDLPELEALHERTLRRSWGALHRCSEMWQWLLQRETHDDLLADFYQRGPKRKLGGYVVRRRGHLLEVVVDRHRPAPLARLLRRHARDAIERGDHAVYVHGLRGQLVHQWFSAWGGLSRSVVDAPWGAVLLSPERWLERIYPTLRSRAKHADLSLPLEITLGEPGAAWRLIVSRRSAHWEPLEGAAPQAMFSAGGIQALLLGAAPPTAQPPSGDAPAITVLNTLFPRQEWGVTTFDVL